MGRFQPFHDGHKKCVEKILEKHNKCIILLRETLIDVKNPHTVEERVDMIEKIFGGDKVLVGAIPDEGCDLTVYIGRGVGYDLIQLDAETEKISATDIRKKLYEKRE